MAKNYRNLEKYIERTIPLENMIKEARRIENLHNLIKNNGKKFDISEEEIKLAEKLVNQWKKVNFLIKFLAFFIPILYNTGSKEREEF